MKTVKDMITKTNMIELKIEEYADALKKSMYDEQWINNLYTDKENLFRLFEKVGKNCPIKNAVRFAETRDIRYLLETKNNLTLPESISNLYFEAGKPEQTMILINEIFSSTLYYAERIKDLINEYSMNTRTFFETTFSSLCNLRRTFLISSDGGSFSGFTPLSIKIFLTARLLSICSCRICLSPSKSFSTTL